MCGQDGLLLRLCSYMRAKVNSKTIAVHVRQPFMYMPAKKHRRTGVTVIAVSRNRFEVMPLLLGDTYGGKGISILIDLAIVSVDIKVVAATSTCDKLPFRIDFQGRHRLAEPDHKPVAPVV